MNKCFHCHTVKAYMHAKISSIDTVHIEAIISSDVTKSKEIIRWITSITDSIQGTPGNWKGKVFKRTTSCVCIQLPLRHIESKKEEKDSEPLK